jgi:hypothetical protein
MKMFFFILHPPCDKFPKDSFDGRRALFKHFLKFYNRKNKTGKKSLHSAHEISTQKILANVMGMGVA